MSASDLLTPPTPQRSRRQRPTRSTRRPGWNVAVYVIAAVVVTPVVAVVVESLVTVDSVQWPNDLDEMVVTTLILMLGVAALTFLLGAGLAWLVTAYHFPGRRIFTWLLVLPLAMPAYILGFVFLSIFDYAGPVQSALRSVFGENMWFPEVRSLTGAIVVMSFTLYPYVYLLARSALLEQAPRTFDAARSLGASRRRAVFRVVLPLARPSLAAGLALVMMETLTDFATVRYFNVQPVSLGVYLVWKGSFDRHSATSLAILVLLFAVAVLLIERLLRGRARYHQRGGRGQGIAATELTGVRRWLATAACLAVVSVGFLIPVLQLGWWAIGDSIAHPEHISDPRFVTYLVNSLVVAAVVAGICVILALVIGNGLRLGGGRRMRFAAQLTTFGYAVPGVVVGLGVLIAFAALDAALEGLGVPGGTGLLATGSVIGIIYAYVVRFLAPAYQSVDASFAKISPTMTSSALSLGAAPRRVLRRIHLPLARSGVTVALVLVMIDALKELPIVLLLRPFGFTTVSVWVYQLASESLWRSAALPALLIVAVATVPVVLLTRQVRIHEPPVLGHDAGGGARS